MTESKLTGLESDGIISLNLSQDELQRLEEVRRLQGEGMDRIERQLEIDRMQSISQFSNRGASRLSMDEIEEVKKNRGSKDSGPAGVNYCCDCGLYFKDDIYWVNGRTYCGDCRYFLRHGRMPTHEKGVGRSLPARAHGDDELKGSETAGRFSQQRAANRKQAEILKDLAADCSASLD